MNTNIKAAIWMIGAIGSFVVMAIAGRSASVELDTFEIMLYRSLIGVVIVCALVTYFGRWNRISTDDLGIHFIRNLGHFTGQNLWFYSLTLIPLAHLFALEFTTPIWVLLLSPLLLGVRIKSMAMISALIAFVGILVIVRPGTAPLSIGLLTAGLSAIGFAISIVFTKKLTENHSIECILFYLTAMQAAFGLIMAGYDLDITPPSAAMIPPLVAIGLCGLIAHFCITKALSLAPASVVAPIDFARLPTIAIIGALLYGEAIDVWIFVGAILIFAGNYLNILSETRDGKNITSR